MNLRLNTQSNSLDDQLDRFMVTLNRFLPTCLGVGLAILPIQRVDFLGLLGLTLVLTISFYAVVTHIQQIPKIPLPLLIPVSLLILLMIISPGTSQTKVYALGMFSLFCTVYLFGPTVLKYIGLGAIVGSLSMIVVAIATHFARTGGMYHEMNYNMAVGVITVGILLWRGVRQWLLIPIMLVALFFTGAEEAIVGIALISVVMLLRKDYGKRTLLIIMGMIIFVVVLLPFNIPQRLWGTTPFRLEAATKGDTFNATDGRLNVINNSLRDVRFLGHGYAPDNTKPSSIHNTPLRVLYELGPLGLLTWLWLIIYGLWKTSWKYAFVSLIAFGLFDHFMWTQLAPYTFTLLGMCSYYSKSDRIFTSSTTDNIVAK